MAGSSEMPWLYDENSAKPKSEDYLLGKAVDASFERGTLGQINAVEYDCTPASIFASKAEHQVDIQRKLQEDPLVALKKTEVDTRKRLLDNPIKMRELQQYIKKMKKKKSKKKKKKRGKDSDDSDEDLDALLKAKLAKLQGGGDDDDEKDSDSSEYEERTLEKPKERRRSRSRSRERQKRNRSPDRRRRSRSRDRSDRHKERDRDRDRNRDHGSSRRDRSNERRRQRSRSRSRDRSSYKRRERSRSRELKPKQSKDFGGRAKSSSKMSEEEKAKKLREMMSNADWRDEQRTKKVKQYREEETKEENDHYSKDHDPEFVRKQLIKAAEAGSVEKRIQSNRHNIQRSGMAMDKNFARR